MKLIQHDKIKALNDENIIIGQFLEWLQEDYVIAKYLDEEWAHSLCPANVTIEGLLADYYDIDLDALEAEKRYLLKKQMELNEQNEEKD